MKRKKVRIQKQNMIIITAVIIYVIMMLSGLGRIRTVMEGDVKSHLRRISAQSQNMVEGQFQNEYKNVAQLSRLIGSNGILQKNTNIALLERMQMDRENVQYVVSTLDGESYCTTGEQENIAKSTIFQEQLKRENAYYGMGQYPLSGQEGKVFLVSAPIQEDGNTSGILTACYDMKQYEENMSTSEFAGGSQSYLLTEDGKLVYMPAKQGTPFGPEAYKKFDNNQLRTSNSTMKKMSSDMKEQKSGILIYNNKSQKKVSYLSYTPLNINKWYLVNEIEYKTLAHRNNQIQTIILLMSSGTIVLLALVASILYYFKKKADNERQNVLMHDRLTGLPNRKYLLQFYDKIAEKEGGYVYLLFHVNFFKRTNSLFGFEAGSNLLRDVGSLLSNLVKADECAARASTDFFGMILKNEGREALSQRIDGIFNKLGELDVKVKHVTYDYKCYYTGGANVLDDKDATLEEMNNRAYKVIYDLGEKEESQWAFYEEKQKEEQATQNELAGDIVQALTEKQFVPFFQPQFEIASKEVTGAELLARWNHPKKGILMPGIFLPLLEDAGCVLELDIIMLEEACSQLRNWMNQGLLPVPLSLNFSMLNLHRKDFVERVKQIVEKYDISPAMISLEFKNSAVFDNLEKAKPVFEELKKFGFRLAVDGFGTGDSSFRVMEEVDVRMLKLDRSFVSNIVENEKSQIIIQNVIRMAKELNFTIIAEGVEKEQQMDFLEAAGCKFAQGFLFGKPCSIQELEKIMFEGD